MEGVDLGVELEGVWISLSVLKWLSVRVSWCMEGIDLGVELEGVWVSYSLENIKERDLRTYYGKDWSFHFWAQKGKYWGNVTILGKFGVCIVFEAQTYLILIWFG